jgi:hypothetical protein
MLMVGESIEDRRLPIRPPSGQSPAVSYVPKSCRTIRTVTVATAIASAATAIWSLRRRRLRADLDEECTPKP